LNHGFFEISGQCHWFYPPVISQQFLGFVDVPLLAPLAASAEQNAIK
jgi:hypothetical protein